MLRDWDHRGAERWKTGAKSVRNVVRSLRVQGRSQGLQLAVDVSKNCVLPYHAAPPTNRFTVFFIITIVMSGEFCLSYRKESASITYSAERVYPIPRPGSLPDVIYDSCREGTSTLMEQMHFETDADTFSELMV